MKNALFLGGSKGLGLELAKQAMADGYQITIMSRKAHACPLVKEGGVNSFDLNLARPGIFHEPLRSYAISHEPFDLIVWTAGAYQEGNILDLVSGYDTSRVESMYRMHLEGPSVALIELLNQNREKQTPCHLMVAASSTSYRVREGEGLYGACKAGKAQLARMLGLELPRLVPGSKVMLAHPGGMNTPFWEGRDQPKLANFMDPVAVARVVWDEMKAQTQSFVEIHIDREPDRTPKIVRGARLPES